MKEREIEELLGAYALDAVETYERLEIEEHLTLCAKCRAEVVAHREVASLLANSNAPVPEGLWERIANELSPELPAHLSTSSPLIEQLRPTARLRRSRTIILAMAGAAAGIVVIVLLSLQVANLTRQVHSDTSSSGAIRAAVASVLAHPHRTILLTSTAQLKASVAVASDGEAYWVKSNLAPLKASSTYQLWTTTRGMTVSLGVLGNNPNVPAEFRLESGMHGLMVTVEPAGGTPQPTTPVLLSATT